MKTPNSHQTSQKPFPNPKHWPNFQYLCRYETILYTQLGDVTQKIRFYVINGGKENAILGHPWLEAANPIINWKKGTVTIPPIKDQSLALSFAHLAEQASYLSKNTCPAIDLNVNPRKETTLNPVEQTGLDRKSVV